MCIMQGFWPPLKPKIETYFTTFSLVCFMNNPNVSIHIYLTLTVSLVTENGRQYRLKLHKMSF